MATDMPSSPSHAKGKMFYAAALAVVVVILLFGGIKFAYLSLGILILNAFSSQISEDLRPTPWGHSHIFKSKFEKITRLSSYILLTTFAVIGLEKTHHLSWVIYAFIAYVLYQYIFNTQKKLHHPL